MAGDWIKFEHVTPDKPEVINMSDILNIDQDAVVGKLVRIWIWADQNSVDGNALSVTDSFLDRLVFQIGFAKALRQVGWLSGKNGKITLPQFERHNGETAKKRASTNRRVAKSRSKKSVESKSVTSEGNGNVTPEALQKALPEKRREEKSIESKDSITPLPPEGELELESESQELGITKTNDLLEEFWQLMPSTSRNRSTKSKVKSAWQRIKKSEKPTPDAFLDSVRAWIESDDWQRDGGKFVQGAHLYIKDKKWESLPEAPKVTTTPKTKENMTIGGRVPAGVHDLRNLSD